MRLPRLREIARDGWPTFVSYEPALGPIEWEKWFDIGCIGWLIADGESGPKARPPHPDWIRSARNACGNYSVPFHFKQWGEFAPVMTGREEFERPLREREGERIVGPNGEFLGYPHADRFDVMRRIGKKAAGAMLDGHEWRDFPIDRKEGPAT